MSQNTNVKRLYDAIHGNRLLKVQDLLTNNPKLVNIPYEGKYPLLFALRIGNKNITNYLLGLEYIDLSVEDVNQFNVMHHAALYNNLDLIERMVNEGYDINAMTSDDTTALYHAIENGNYDMVVYLVNNGATILIDDIFMAIYYDEDIIGTKCFELLLTSKQSSIDDYDIYQLMSYTLSYSDYFDVLNKRYPDAIKNVINDANIGPYNRGLLHNAAHTGQSNTIKKLLALDTSPNLVNKDGNTALHMVAIKGIMGRSESIKLTYLEEMTEIVIILINGGADVTIKNNEGKTPEDIARNNGNIELANIIKEHSNVDIKEPEFM